MAAPAPARCLRIAEGYRRHRELMCHCELRKLRRHMTMMDPVMFG
jgi:hypothetical protein